MAIFFIERHLFQKAVADFITSVLWQKNLIKKIANLFMAITNLKFWKSVEQAIFSLMCLGLVTVEFTHFIPGVLSETPGRWGG